MASAKEIRGQIKAIQNTAKITKAMEMVAASKMKKAQDRVLDARAYEQGVNRVISNLMQSHPEYRHPFLQVRDEINRVGIILVTTDKGLCGSLNVNVFKATLGLIRRLEGKEIEGINIGRRGGMFLKRVAKLAGAAENIPDSPELTDILGVVQLAMNRFMDGECDEVYLVYSKFINTMTQVPTVDRLLPCPAPEEADRSGYWDYIYEPEAREVLDGLMHRYVESLVYHAVLENKACEQSARMVAMKSATDNAKEIVKDLSITYNKARQAAITMELSEIVSGAAATQ